MGRRGKPRRVRPKLNRGNNPLKHIGEMRAAFPDFACQVGRDRTVTWEGDFQPNPSSPRYRLRLIYERWGPPKVFVLHPALPENAPHRWPDGSLCLYWPKEWRWTDHESIPDTIMAWAALWLEYYEIWQTLGVWLGPSSHDEFPKEEDDS